MTRPSDVFRMYALSMVGLPYRWAGDDTIEGFDCSGLAQELLASEGLDPPGDQTAQELHDYFLSRSKVGEMGLGSLVFYGKSVSEISHVAIGLNGFQVIEAGGGGSKTTTRQAAVDQNAFIRVRPHDRRKDIVAILNPFGI